MQVSAVGPDRELKGATLIAGVLEGLEPLPGNEEILASVDERLISTAGFEGKKGQVLSIPHQEAETLLLAGVGEEASFQTIRAASGNAIRQVKTARALSLLATAEVDDSARAVVEGSLLGGYQYRSYKTDDENASKVETVEVVTEADLNEASVLCAVTILARDWVNTPAADKSPETLAHLIEEAASDAGVDSEVWGPDRISEEGLGGLLGVAAGSDRAPAVVILQYRPDGASEHLALVGKGITFDSGGLSIKPAASMEEMKDDMAGGAAVAAATIGIARLGLPVSVTAIVPVTDNAVGGDATRPGDVLRPVQGPTIEVLNTDAEGRLILADGLGLARRFDPDLIVDVATLTGAAKVALGGEIGAVFGSDRETAARVLEAAQAAGESFWEMPLHRGYRKSLDSNIADIKNISGDRWGGAIVAALFLAEYAGEGPWAHLDIAGPARSGETAGEFVKGASGVGVRTLVELARGMARAG